MRIDVCDIEFNIFSDMPSLTEKIYNESNANIFVFD